MFIFYIGIFISLLLHKIYELAVSKIALNNVLYIFLKYILIVDFGTVMINLKVLGNFSHDH